MFPISLYITNGNRKILAEYLDYFHFLLKEIPEIRAANGGPKSLQIPWF